jgi:putative membrane protein insertion efficiency factor
VIALIRLYQLTLAKTLTPRCRFTPTCSQYTIDAIQVKGLIRGAAVGAWRVVRCGPWTAGGFDPVHIEQGATGG